MAACGTSFDPLFLQMMIRHHQGRPEMANKETRRSQHPQAKTLAEGSPT